MAYWCHAASWIWVSISCNYGLYCSLFGDKPLSEPMLTYYLHWYFNENIGIDLVSWEKNVWLHQRDQNFTHIRPDYFNWSLGSHMIVPVPAKQYWRKFVSGSQESITICYTMMTSSNGNIFRVTGHLSGHRWIPHTKASDSELCCFFYLRLNKRWSKQSRGWWFETLSRPLWRHCNATTKQNKLGVYFMGYNFHIRWLSTRLQ